MVAMNVHPRSARFPRPSGWRERGRGAVRIGLLLGIAFLWAGRAHGGKERQAFLYREGDASGAVVHDYAGRWVEMVGTEERFRFEEVSRSDETIELLDSGRDVGLRIHAAAGELRLPRSSVWGPWKEGKWVDRDDLPVPMRFLPTDHKIRVAYFVPSDRQPLADYERRIRVVLEFVADAFESDLKAKAYRTEGLAFESNGMNEPVVHLIRGEREARHYNDAPGFDHALHFDRIRQALPSEFGNERRHMLFVFAETYEPGPAPVEWAGSIGRGLHHNADGGVAVMSSWILRDEFCGRDFAEQKRLMLDTAPIAGRTALDHRRPNSPRFEFIEDGFGAVVHEFGHALGLPHDYRQPNDLMGHGFRRLQANYLAGAGKKRPIGFSKENARLLGVSRYLGLQADLTDNTGPRGDVSVRLRKGSPPTALVAVKATDDRSLRGVLLHSPQSDTVLGGSELKGHEQSIEIKLPLKDLKGSEWKLTTLIIDGGGNIATIETSTALP